MVSVIELATNALSWKNLRNLSFSKPCGLTYCTHNASCSDWWSCSIRHYWVYCRLFNLRDDPWSCNIRGALNHFILGWWWKLGNIWWVVCLLAGKDQTSHKAAFAPQNFLYFHCLVLHCDHEHQSPVSQKKAVTAAIHLRYSRRSTILLMFAASSFFVMSPWTCVALKLVPHIAEALCMLDFSCSLND